MINRSKITFISIAILLVIVGVATICVWRNGNPFKKAFPKNSLVIFDCSSVEPRNLTVKEGDVINFVNAGKTDHTIVIANNSFVVPAGKIKEITADFSAGEAVYGYSCDSISLAGQVQIISASPAVLTDFTFKDSYDTAPQDKQPCLKEALGDEFQKAYNDSTYMPEDTHSILEKMEKCFAKDEVAP